MHNQLAVERYFQQVPPAAVDELLKFRDTHPLKQIAVRGVRWTYLIAGRGPATLLILPGLLGFGEMSFQHIRAFETDYRVVAPDYPFEITTMRELVDGLAALLDAEGIKRVHVLGGSYGGMVAQWLVRRYPQRVASLVLSHTGGPKIDRAAANRRVIALLRLLPMNVLRFMLKGATRKSLKDAPEQLPFWEAYSNEMIARLSKADLIGRYQAATDFDASSAFTPDDLTDWSGRILILEGDNDPIAEAPARAALKALHPRASVHTFHGSGHVASIAKLDEYVAVIKHFLRDAAQTKITSENTRGTR